MLTILAYGCLLLLFIPKINLISVAGENAGLRIDDFMIACFAGWLLLARRRARVSRRLEYLFGAFILAGVASALLNGSSLLYVLRPIEYFMFFYAGAVLCQRVRLDRIIAAWLIVNAGIMVLQSTGLVGAFSIGTYVEASTDRVMGVTGGPWEISALLNLILACYAFGRGVRQVIRNLVIGLLLLSLVLLTGARSGVAAHVFLLACYLLYCCFHKTTRVKAAVFSGLALAGTVALVLNSEPLQARTGSLFRSQNLAYAAEVYAKTDVSLGTKVDINTVAATGFALDPEKYDISWVVRMQKWSYVAKCYQSQDPLRWLFGMGPGVWGPAVDGGWLRMITEHGIVGTGLFLAFLLTLGAHNRMLLACALVLMLNMCFIDIYLAYKMMSMFFFIAGFSHAQERLRPSLRHTVAPTPVPATAVTASP